MKRRPFPVSTGERPAPPLKLVVLDAEQERAVTAPALPPCPVDAAIQAMEKPRTSFPPSYGEQQLDDAMHDARRLK